ncbi:MAG: DUF3489 domain-containing protein [Magnetococcus sp. THC-1_WYH]
MNQLTTTQETILKAAITREDRSIHPLPSHIKGGAARKVITSLRTKGLIGMDDTVTMHALLGIDPDLTSERIRYLHRIEAEENARKDTAAFAATQGMVWDGQIQADDVPATTTLEADPTAENACEPSAATPLESDNDFEADVATAEQAIAKAPKEKARNNTKKAKVIEMLKRPEGATAAQIAEATGWQGHTIRGFLSIAKKKLGLVITTNKLRVVGPNQQGSPGSFTTYFAQ